MLYRFVISAFYLVVVLLTASCANVASYVISHPKDVFLQTEGITSIVDSMQLEEREICSQSSPECISYFVGNPYANEEAASAVAYSVSYFGADAPYIKFERQPAQFGGYKGTVIIMHGYGANKNSMLLMSDYFRSLGFSTIIPDLFGHGKTKGDIAFGSTEHQLLSKIIANSKTSIDFQMPVIAFGYSMGSVVAMNLLIQNTDVDFAIIQAPMIEFTKAVNRVVSTLDSSLTFFFSKRSIESGALLSLANAKVDLGTINIEAMLNKMNKPVLIVQGEKDRISPAAYFANIENENIEQFVIKSRYHKGMLFYSNDDAIHVEKWLRRVLKN